VECAGHAKSSSWQIERGNVGRSTMNNPTRLIVDRFSIQDYSTEGKRGVREKMVYFVHGILFLVHLHKHC